MSELSEDPFVVALRLGLDLVEPADDELFIDIDDAESLAAYEDGVKILADNGVPFVETKRTVSRSGNTHIYGTIKWDCQPTPLIMVAVQAVLGSDRKRELLALLRIAREYEIPPRCFFEVPPTN